jgi:hypothetical protein
MLIASKPRPTKHTAGGSTRGICVMLLTNIYRLRGKSPGPTTYCVVS